MSKKLSTTARRVRKQRLDILADTGLVTRIESRTSKGRKVVYKSGNLMMEFRANEGEAHGKNFPENSALTGQSKSGAARHFVDEESLDWAVGLMIDVTK